MKKAFKSIVVTILSAVLLAMPAMADTPPAETAAYHGVDIYHGTSEHGQIDWQQLKATQDFVYIKADEGENWVDPMYRANVAAAKSVGLKWGTYHFLRLYSVDSARQQADTYWSRIQGTGYDLIPALDFESHDSQDTAAGMRACVRAFVDEFQRISSIKPIIYCNTYYANTYLRGQFTDCKLWLADYRGYAGDVVGWGAWHAWQYSEHGSVSAIANDEVDLDKATAGILLTGMPSTVSGGSEAAAAISIFRGSSHVLTIQQQLNDTGIARPKLDEDGFSGPLTTEAIKVHQTVAGISVDGVWGPQSIRAIEAIYARPTLKYGSTGSVVSYLQYRLGIRFDGCFGAQTEAAVRAFQTSHGLPADGSVGPLTWAALMS